MTTGSLPKPLKMERQPISDQRMTGLMDLPNEIIVSIFTMLYTYQLTNVRGVCSRFKSLIDHKFFNYRFDVDYNLSVKDYVKSYWANISWPLTELQNPNTTNEFTLHTPSSRYYRACTSVLEQSDEYRTQLTEVVEGEPETGQRIYLEGSKFEVAFRQVHRLLKDKFLINVLLREMSPSFFNFLINRCMCPRAIDGYYATIKSGHYVFDNFFGFFIAQIIFVILDGVICLESGLRVTSNSFISSNVNLKTYAFMYKVVGTYALHIPRHLIYKATADIDYDLFYNSLSDNDQLRLNRILLRAQNYIDTCRSCFGRPDLDLDLDSVFINQSFIRRKVEPLYFELSTRLRIITHSAATDVDELQYENAEPESSDESSDEYSDDDSDDDSDEDVDL